MLANLLAEREQSIPAGTYVMTGGITEALAARREIISPRASRRSAQCQSDSLRETHAHRIYRSWRADRQSRAR